MAFELNLVCNSTMFIKLVQISCKKEGGHENSRSPSALCIMTIVVTAYALNLLSPGNFT